jgi:hypothetical protein
MRLVLIDGAIGVVLLAAIAVACVRRQPRRPAWVRATGWLLVALPLPLAVVLRLGQPAFLAGVVAFAVGAAIVLGTQEDGWSEQADDDPPPWWPAFERQFREYEQRPKALR